MALIRRVRIRAYRSAADVELELGRIAALVGEARAGKSNILRAVRALLDATAPVDPGDVRRNEDSTLVVEAELDDGRQISLRARPPEASAEREGAPPVVFLPAGLRGETLVESSPGAEQAARAFEAAAKEHFGSGSEASGAGALVSAFDACCEADVTGVVFILEEPELFLRPHTQRYLYRRLRELAAQGNQVLYSTHAPAFLNVARLDELVLVGHEPERGTQVVRPEPLESEEAFRVVSEFDAERSELFLARAAILVEGRTEKLVLPSVFAALGHDVDRAEISIVECGGKSNIPVFARICQSCGIPFVVVHDRDAEQGKDPIPSEQQLNVLVSEIAGEERVIELAPDFEAVAGLRGHSNKPERAWNHFSTPGVEVPAPLARAVALSLELAGR
jgi:predicted ATP-dependent endonuclease of OLD family